jgi:GT2 family glycosyltransferase
MEPLVSIVTVNYNQTEVTISLLESLRNISYENIEVFVVDNASVENPEKQIKELFPEVNVIVSDANLGFAGGNNLAIKQAKGKYVMLLNNDTVVFPRFLEPLVSEMEKNVEVGICSSKLYFYAHQNTIQYAGSSPLHPIKIQSFAYGYGKNDTGQFNDAKETALAHGAAMLVRSEAIQKVGLMPEEYFLYYEEIDWCESIKKVGYKIMFVPDSIVLHKESMSVGKKSYIQVYYKTRNRILLARKWRFGFEKVLSLGYLSAVVLRDTVKYLLQKNKELAKASARAWWWNVVN